MVPAESKSGLPSKQDFAAHLGSRFSVGLNGAASDFVFHRIDDGIDTKIQQSFSLIFHSPLDVAPQQGLYSVSHGELGDFELFLVPINKTDEHFVYEAVFNLLSE